MKKKKRIHAQGLEIPGANGEIEETDRGIHRQTQEGQTQVA
jgi:hypothetical protein